MTTNTDIILPERNTQVASTCLSASTQPVFDEDGNYRGTNALFDVRLEVETTPKLDYPITYPVDLSDIKVNLIVEHRFDIYAYDVSGMLHVVDYGFTDGTEDEQCFYVDLGTDYTYEKWEQEIEPVRVYFTASANTTTEPPQTLLRGDVNLSGKVDVSDAVLLARFLAEDKTAIISQQGMTNADADKNGAVENEDIVVLLKYIAKIILSL